MRQSKRFDHSVPNSPSTDTNMRGSGPDRGVLLAATELFTQRSRHDVEEKRIFLELACNLLPSTSLQDRRRIATLLAGHPEIPEDLLGALAGDPDELTAYPALRYSPGLSVDLLLRTAVAGPDSLRKAIANRPSLRESVIRALCDHAGANVIGILLDRDDVTLTPDHRARLGRRSDIVATLGLELAGRDALNPDGLMGQFLHLPNQLKARAIAAAEMTSLVKQAQAPGSGSQVRARPPRRKLCDGLHREALRQDATRFADLLSQGLGLPLETCELLLRQDQGDGLTIALKALGMSAQQVTAVLIRLCPGMSLDQLRGLLRLYRTLGKGAAEVLVDQWMLQDQGAQPRHETQYQDTGRRAGIASAAKHPESVPLGKTAGS